MLHVHSTGELHLFVQARWLDPWNESARLAELSKGTFRGLVEPQALSETVASTVRLAARLWAEPREIPSALAGFLLSIERSEGSAIPLGSRWYRQTLTEHDLESDRRRWIRLPESTVESDVVVSGVRELGERADSVGYRLLRDVYESDEAAAEIGPRDIPWFRDASVFEAPI
jgi:hypothetical protein